MVWDIYFWTPPDAEVGFSGRDKYLRAYDCKLKQEILFRVFHTVYHQTTPNRLNLHLGLDLGGTAIAFVGRLGVARKNRKLMMVTMHFSV